MRTLLSAGLIVMIFGCGRPGAEAEDPIPVVTDKSDFGPLAKGNHRFAMDLY